MIHTFKFKNFCSFKDESIIDFTVSKKTNQTKTDMFCDSPSGARLSKVTTVIGANGSGKTSALKALAFLSWFVSNSFYSIKEHEEIPLDMFRFVDKEDGAAEFEVIFEDEAEIYKYILHITKTYIVKEELYKKNRETNHFVYLFKYSRKKQNEKVIVLNNIELKDEIINQILKNNISLISCAGNATENIIMKQIVNFWKNIITNVNRVGKFWNTFSLGENSLLAVTQEYKKNSKLFKVAKKFLANIDLGLDDIKIQKREFHNSKGEIKEIYVPFGIHKINSKDYTLDFQFESSGTKNMFVLLHWILPVLENGGIAVIDELELDLHPHALPKIIDLFANPEINPKNTQLLFTSHSLEILNYLEKEQVFLAEKNDACESGLYRLDEVKGVRRDDNIYAKYMAGVYGAVPRI